MIIPATPAHARTTEGRHRYKPGLPLGFGVRIGGTPDEHKAEKVLLREGRTVETLDGAGR